MSLIEPLAPEQARAFAIASHRRAADADRLRRARELAARLRAVPPAPEPVPLLAPEAHSAVLELPKWWQAGVRSAEMYWVEAMRNSEIGENPPRITTPVILAVVAERYGLAVSTITGPSRRRAVTEARFEAMYLARAILRRSLPEIGRVFKRDHTTVLNAVIKHAQNHGLFPAEWIERQEAIDHMIRCCDNATPVDKPVCGAA